MAIRSTVAAAVACLCCLLTAIGASASIDARFGSTLQEIQARSPYRYVRDVILAAEGETKSITCSFDSLYTAGKHWKRTFYTPVSWFSYAPSGTKKPTVEEPITDGKSMAIEGRRPFAYKLVNPMSVAPSSILVLESVPLRLTDTYFICRTSLQPGSVQVFYLKVIKPILSTPSGPSGGQVQAQLGAKVKLDCHTGNNFPATSVYWSRRRAGSKLTGRQAVLAWGATYELAGVTATSARYEYTCHVNNHLDPEWRANFRIDLVNASMLQPGPITATYNGVRPAFRARSSQATPQYDRPYTMSCRVQGDGLKFGWLRNGTELRPYADPNLYTYSSSQGKQHFTDLILKKFRTADRGVYECRASNEAGASRFVFDLKAVQSTESPPSPLGPDESPGPSAGGAQQQQRLGSGWGAGSGDDETDDPQPLSSSAAAPAAPAAAAASATSGDRRPPTLPTAARRIRRHGKRSRIRAIALP